MLKITKSTIADGRQHIFSDLRQLLLQMPANSFQILNDDNEAPINVSNGAKGETGQAVSIGLFKSDKSIIYVEYFNKNTDYLYTNSGDDLFLAFSHEDVMVLMERIENALYTIKHKRKRTSVTNDANINKQKSKTITNYFIED